jgi:hypothetical protein
VGFTDQGLKGKNIMKRTLLQHIASLIVARLNCQANGNTEWRDKHEETLAFIAANLLPSGSGVDSGSDILLDHCTTNRIVLACSFHHMNEGGYYDGWTHHTIVLTPSFDGFNLRVTGTDRNQIKEYLADLFHNCLSEEYHQTADGLMAV